MRPKLKASVGERVDFCTNYRKSANENEVDVFVSMVLPPHNSSLYLVPLRSKNLEESEGAMIR